MKKMPIAGILILLTFLFSCGQKKPTLDELRSFAATETFPEDKYLDTISNKNALIIVAHDDDDCAMAGTIAKLKSKGWKIWQLSFTTHQAKGTNIHPAVLICEGNQEILADGLYRKGLDTMKNPYLPIPREQFKEQFYSEKVKNALIEKINAFNPSVIFTLDNVKGGYGHPEHIFISQLTLDLFQQNTLSAQRVYQSVYTDHMEKEIVDTWLKIRMQKWGYPNASEIANKMYGINGMPAPTTQVSIRPFGEDKMAYLLAYPEDVRKNLRKFIPYFEEFDADTYFGIFDREFFRVVERE